MASELTTLFETFFLLLEDKREHVVKTYQAKIDARTRQDTFLIHHWQDKNGETAAHSRDRSKPAREPTTAQVVDHWFEVLETPACRKHLVWVIRQWCSRDFRFEDIPRIKQAIEKFESVKARLENKDLNSYKSLADVEEAVEAVEGSESKRQAKQKIKLEGVERVYESSAFVLLKVLTRQAAQYYGKGTKWCTAADMNNMFDEYSKSGPLYVILDKNEGRKWQFHTQSHQFMDERDNTIRDNDILLLLKDPGLVEKVGPLYPVMFRQFVPTAKYESWLLASNDGITIAEYATSKEKRWPEGEDALIRIMKSGEREYCDLTIYIRKMRQNGVDVSDLEPKLIGVAKHYAESSTELSVDALNNINSLHRALMILGNAERIPALEETIERLVETDVSHTYLHTTIDTLMDYYDARVPIGERWNSIEPFLCSRRVLQYQMRATLSYLANSVRARWPEFEAALNQKIDNIPRAILVYAKTLKERQPHLEELLVANETAVNWQAIETYWVTFVNEKWPVIEPALLRDLEGARRYNNYVSAFLWTYLHGCGRWPEAEQWILTQGSQYFGPYVSSILKQRWPEAEHYILSNEFLNKREVVAHYLRALAQARCTDRWEEGEEIVKKSPELWAGVEQVRREYSRE